ncbi:MAG: hypothetical protein K0R73_600 [Candidatus Midichloriaceae bacterium]|jgi:hypothetical protein|nr:hypothetical protein [Candidatus Midichloriaceae bacterium]
MKQNSNPAVDIALMSDVLNFITNKEDTEADCELLKRKLSKLGSGAVTRILDFRFNNEILHLNLAGYIFTKLPFKKNFLSCILELEPQLLLQITFTSQCIDKVKSVDGINIYGDSQPTGTTIYVTSPLILAIKNRSPEMVTTVLSHQIFLDERNYDVTTNCLRLIDSYCWAIRWYYDTNTEAEKEILEMIFASASESMREAGKQGQSDLLKFLKESFSSQLMFATLQHNGPNNHNIHMQQLSDLQKLCNVFEEVLPQKEVEIEAPKEEKWSPLAWGAGALIIGLGACVLAKFLKNESSIER